MQHEDITEKVIGCCYRVYNSMGFGFQESVYQKCLCIELRKAGVLFECEKEIVVRYEGEVVGEFRADILIEGRVLLELKSVRALVPAHEAQLVNYLIATGIDVGLLVNFGESKVEVKRKVRQLC